MPVSEINTQPKRPEISGKGWCRLPAMRETETTARTSNTSALPEDSSRNIVLIDKTSAAPCYHAL